MINKGIKKILAAAALLGWLVIISLNQCAMAAEDSLNDADMQTLQTYVAQNPELAKSLQAASLSPDAAAKSGITPQSIAKLQKFFSRNPEALAQANAILKGNQTTKVTTTTEQPTEQTTVSVENSPANTEANTTTSTTVATTGSENNPGTSVVDVQTETFTPLPDDPWQPATPRDKHNKELAFRGVATQAFPLTPDQIKLLNSMLDATQRAQAAAPNDKPPEPTSSSLIVNLEPGATPPVIRLAKGFVSSLVFVDSTGAPWQIESYDLGNPRSFNIQWDKKSNTLMVQSLATYTYGNLAVKLVTLNTPVMLTLVPGQQQIDYRVDLRVQGLGPNAKPSIQGMGLPEQADNVLLDILDGVAPRGAKQLRVSGPIADVWQVNDVLFVRTRFTLLSPAWMAKMSSADGMNAYKLQMTPLLLVSRYGKVRQLKVEGF